MSRKSKVPKFVRCAVDGSIDELIPACIMCRKADVIRILNEYLKKHAGDEHARTVLRAISGGAAVTTCTAGTANPATCGTAPELTGAKST